MDMNETGETQVRTLTDSEILEMEDTLQAAIDARFDGDPHLVELAELRGELATASQDGVLVGAWERVYVALSALRRVAEEREDIDLAGDVCECMESMKRPVFSATSPMVSRYIGGMN
jgi:hypothetical protein